MKISTDNAFPMTPEWTYHIGGQYTVPLGTSGEITGRVDYSYTGEHFTDPQNLIFQDAYSLLGARLTYVSPDDRWSAALFGTNLTDEVYVVGGTAGLLSLGFNDEVRGRPREYGVSVTLNF